MNYKLPPNNEFSTNCCIYKVDRNNVEISDNMDFLKKYAFRLFASTADSLMTYDFKIDYNKLNNYSLNEFLLNGSNPGGSIGIFSLHDRMHEIFLGFASISENTLYYLRIPEFYREYIMILKIIYAYAGVTLTTAYDNRVIGPYICDLIGFLFKETDLIDKSIILSYGKSIYKFYPIKAEMLYTEYSKNLIKVNMLSEL